MLSAPLIAAGLAGGAHELVQRVMRNIEPVRDRGRTRLRCAVRASHRVPRRAANNQRAVDLGYQRHDLRLFRHGQHRSSARRSDHNRVVARRQDDASPAHPSHVLVDITFENLVVGIDLRGNLQSCGSVASAAKTREHDPTLEPLGESVDRTRNFVDGSRNELPRGGCQPAGARRRANRDDDLILSFDLRQRQAERHINRCCGAKTRRREGGRRRAVSCDDRRICEHSAQHRCRRSPSERFGSDADRGNRCTLATSPPRHHEMAGEAPETAGVLQDPARSYTDPVDIAHPAQTACAPRHCVDGWVQRHGCGRIARCDDDASSGRVEHFDHRSRQ